MKLLLERRSKIIAQIEEVMKKAEKEDRAFTNDEIEKVNEYKEQISNIDETIKAKEEARSLMTTIKKSPSSTPPNDTIKSISDEIRSLKTDKELELGTRELRDKTHTLDTGAIGTGNASTQTIAKTTFADYILDKLAYVSPLYGAVRHERFGNSKHQIPVQANKLGKFVPMQELAEYSKQVANFKAIKLEAHKFGTLISFSQEALEDTGYNLESELLRQLAEAYSITLDELIVKGNTAYGVQGLESFTVQDGAKEVKLTADIKPEILTELYFSLPIRYRATATWVISDQTAKALTDMKFEDGTPVLVSSYNGSPVGMQTTILGRPVIVSEYITNLDGTGTAIYFGDLKDR